MVYGLCNFTRRKQTRHNVTNKNAIFLFLNRCPELMCSNSSDRKEKLY